MSLRKRRKTWIVTEREKNVVYLTEWNVTGSLRVTREGRVRRNGTEEFEMYQLVRKRNTGIKRKISGMYFRFQNV